MHVWYADSTLEDSIELSLIEQLRMLGSNGFQFNGDLLVSLDVSAMVDVTEGTTAEFSR